jgi:hypothetical protein
VAQALAQASRLMAADPAKAGEQARAILEAVPGQPQARLYLGMAARRTGDAALARDVLDALAAEQPKAPAVWGSSLAWRVPRWAKRMVPSMR